MPKGPKGEKRHADPVKNAVLIARIATGEAEDTKGKAPGRAIGGRAGGKARANKLDQAQKSAIAKAGAESRWKNK